MIKLNRKVEYALMALKLMGQKRPGQLTTAKEVADRFHASFEMTARVLQTLSQQGILKSEQGQHGGYQIVKDLSRINILTLNEILLGETPVAKCLSKEKTDGCELASSCNIMTPVKNLNSRVSDFLKTLSVADVIEVNHGH